MTNAAPAGTLPALPQPATKTAATSPNSAAPGAAQPTAKAATKIPWPASAAAEQTSGATYKCPKCGTNARDVARFCPRCHTTLRFECPSYQRISIHPERRSLRKWERRERSAMLRGWPLSSN